MYPFFDWPGVAVVRVCPQGVVLEANPAACQFFGFPEGGLTGVSVQQITHPEDLERSLQYYPGDGCGPARNFSYEKRYLRQDGRVVHGRVSVVWVPGDGELPRHGVALIQGLTESQCDQGADDGERNLFQSVVDSIFDPIKVVDLNHRILVLNRAAQDLIDQQCPHAEGLLCHQVSKKGHLPCTAVAGVCNLDKIQATRQPTRTVQHQRLASGEEVVFEVTAVPLLDEQGGLKGIVETARNITDLLKAEARIEEHEKRLDYLSHYDLVTRLPNRTLLYDRMHQTLARARRASSQVAVLLLDLDRFKKINDSLGTRNGDLLLYEVAQRLGRHVREADTLARRGEDEFVVVLEQLSDINQVVEVAQRLLGELAQEFVLGGVPLFTTASIGVSLYPDDAEDVEGVLRCADAALHRAQAEGGNAYQFYTVDMTAQTRERMELEGELRKALWAEQLMLYYQPQIDLVSGRCIGTEALMRWKHPQKGMISPGVFIPVAEESGLIESIGLWALRTACFWNKRLQDQGLEPLPVSVNISARQLYRADFPETVAAILEETGLAAQYLELEITESMLMKDVDSAIAIMTRLNRLGLSIAMDDFGTGYSSLSYLRQFPIQKLKIDQSFIRDLEPDASAKAIAQAIVALSRSLGLRTIAEGVETAAQAQLLQTMGCREIQGYLFSRPLPPQEAEAFLCRNGSGDLDQDPLHRLA